ncbi:hypothetical protein [Ruania halotolerans]|uniref:hypothetical protein n=1 Tax=Ruania halotolerans TaxID=2897773 RepID=UPI001E455725|nr:hypothetical protein [Ruania halotolerans]UFU06760.1 hypothetical protein LQF10_01205 [Ruania halotolerans]
MTHQGSRRSTVCAMAAAIALATVAGCSVDSLIEEGVERAVEEAAEAEGENVDVDLDSEDGGFVVESDEGSFSVGGDLPDSFPGEDIPLIDGEILSASAMQSDGASGWAVQIQATGADAFERAQQALEGAGFGESGESFSMSSGDLEMVGLDNGHWQVLLASIEGEGVVSYTVNEM